MYIQTSLMHVNGILFYKIYKLRDASQSFCTKLCYNLINRHMHPTLSVYHIRLALDTAGDKQGTDWKFILMYYCINCQHATRPNGQIKFTPFNRFPKRNVYSTRNSKFLKQNVKQEVSELLSLHIQTVTQTCLLRDVFKDSDAFLQVPSKTTSQPRFRDSTCNYVILQEAVQDNLCR